MITEIGALYLAGRITAREYIRLLILAYPQLVKKE